MLSLILMLVFTFIGLTIFLWIGTFFFQGYIYTEPSQQLYWQAPAAALLLTFGYTLWSFAIALGKDNSPQNIPIDSLARFSPRLEMLDRPAPRIWAIKQERQPDDTIKELPPVEYVNVRTDQKKFHYKDTSVRSGPWQGSGVAAIELEKSDGSKIRFDLLPTGKGEYRQFMSADGWLMYEYEEGPTGLPARLVLSRLIWNLLFNFAHLLGWFIALWLILRFQWSHAFGFAIVLWGVVTIVLLPMLLTYSGYVSLTRRTPTVAACEVVEPVCYAASWQIIS